MSGHPARESARWRSGALAGFAICALLVLALPAAAQTFQRAHGTTADERVEGIVPIAGGGFAVVGTRTNATQDSEILLQEIASHGTIELDRLYGGPDGEVGRSVLQTSDGGYLVVGSTQAGAPGGGLLVLRLSSTGGLVWSTAIVDGALSPTSRLHARGVAEGLGAFWICGAFAAVPIVESAPLLVCIGSNGGLLWERYYVDSRYGGSTSGSFEAIVLDGTEAVLAGTTGTGSQDATRDTLLARVDTTSGSPLWARSAHVDGARDDGLGLARLAGGGFLVSGFDASLGAAGGSFLLRTTSGGVPLWRRTFAGLVPTRAFALTPGEGAVIGGFAGDDAAALATDAAGALLWSRRYGGPGGERFEAAVALADGFLLAGATSSIGAGGSDLYLVRTDAGGTSGCLEAPLAMPPAADSATDDEITLTFQAGLAWEPLVPGALLGASSEVVACADGFLSETFCHGDGGAAACPCGNEAPAGSAGGCLNSLGLSARLTAAGWPSVAQDTLVLHGSGMPNSTALYLQATERAAGGQGAPFGDGLQCLAGTFVRLGTKANAAHASSYPSGSPAVSVRGGVPSAGGTYHYAVWYRNAASFCSPATFNQSNGLSVTWIP